jgi:hypothetical protein
MVAPRIADLTFVKTHLLAGDTVMVISLAMGRLLDPIKAAIHTTEQSSRLPPRGCHLTFLQSHLLTGDTITVISQTRALLWRLDTTRILSLAVGIAYITLGNRRRRRDRDDHGLRLG